MPGQLLILKELWMLMLTSAELSSLTEEQLVLD